MGGKKRACPIGMDGVLVHSPANMASDDATGDIALGICAEVSVSVAVSGIASGAVVASVLNPGDFVVPDLKLA